MQFNSHADEQDIVHQTWFLTGTDSTSYPLKDLARNSNEAISRVALLILLSMGRMQWDDVNHGNQPIASFDLEEDVGTYTIFKAVPNALQDWLEAERVDIVDSEGNGYKLKPLDHRDIKVAISEFQDTSNIPRWFEINGNEIKFYPAPDYTTTGATGCTIYFNRAPSYFLSTDTTKKPGFASIVQDYIYKYNSMQWFFAHDQLQRSDRLKVELKGNNPNVIGGMEKDIVNFYSRRNKAEKTKITRNKKQYV